MSTPDNIPPIRPDLPPIPDNVPPTDPDDRKFPDNRKPGDVEVPDDVEPGNDADIDRGGAQPQFDDETVPATRKDDEGGQNPSPMNPAFP